MNGGDDFKGFDVGDDDLRRMADDLEAQINAGQPGRYVLRMLTVGSLVVSGKLQLHVTVLEKAREAAAQDSDKKTAKSDLALLDRELLRLHEYRFNGDQLTGPSSPPGGDPGDAPEPQDEGASPSPGAAGESGSGGGGGGTVSRSAARREIKRARDYADWRAQVRGFDVWTQCQARRAWLFGRVHVSDVLSQPAKRERVRRRVDEGGDADEIALWSEDDVCSDYTPKELGAGTF